MANPFTEIFKRKGTIIVPQSAPGVIADPSAANGIALDATVSQSHSRSSTITEFSVGLGNTATDHVVRAQQTLSVSGVFTDTPVGFLAGVIDVFDEQSAAQLLTGDLRSRALRRFDSLEEFWNRRRFLTVFTTVKTYRDAQIESLEAVRDQDTGDTVGVSLTFREVRILSTAFSQAIVDTAAAIAGAGAGTEELGTQAAGAVG